LACLTHSIVPLADLTAAFRDAFRSLQHPQSHHLPPIDIASVAYPDNGYEQYTIVEVGDDSPVANAVFPKIAEFLAAKRFPDAAWVVKRPLSDKSGVPGMSQILS
jgi:hypothetical protein